MVSRRIAFLGFFDRIDEKEKKQEEASNMPITDVNSSIKLVAALSLTCREVITKRQNPRRLADVLRMCFDVLFAIV